MTHKLTKWFSGKVFPVREGVYETYDKYLNSNYYNYFDGERWYFGYCTRAEAYVIEKGAGVMDEDDVKLHVTKWRGVLK